MASRLAAPIETEFPTGDFASWMASEQQRVYLLCCRMLRDPDEAGSATQDAFLKAYRALGHDGAGQIEDPAKWLTRIAVNTCLDVLRSRRWKLWKRRSSSKNEETILAMTASRSPSQDDLVFATEIARRMSDALEQLSPRQRAVFLLKHFEDRRLDEIAEILELDLGTVKAHMSRALAKMRTLLEDLYHAPTGGAAVEVTNHG